MTDVLPARLAVPVSDRDHVQGPATAAVTLVEYGDYECPYCRAAEPIVEDLRRLLGDDLRFVFRHFPLTRVHPHSQQAAEAAEAAGAQGRYFEMHTVLFANADALADGDLAGYAAELGLDVDRFKREITARAHASHIREDFLGGRRSGVNGTPTFFLDGERYDGLVGIRQLLAAIRERHPDVIDEELERQVDQRAIPRVVRERSPFQSEE
jgi:protein-disulfide isomerase